MLKKGNFTARILIDEEAYSPVDSMDMLGTLVTWHRSYCFDKAGDKEFGTPADFIRYAKQAKAVVLPVGMYDHSGVTLYEGSQPHAFDQQGWDSGQVGFIYTTKDRFQKVCDTNLHHWRKRATQALREELKLWDLWAHGECYGYVITPPGDEGDSCWGFFGFEDAKQAAEEALADACAREQRAIELVQTGFAL